jgi:hypothetical protein
LKLPNADRAVIPEEKLRDYLLDARHRANRGKARLFAALGYERQSWERLASDLRDQHLSQDAVEVRADSHGRRCRIDANLRGPRGEATIRSVWIVDIETGVPRFVTAYQVKR